MKHKHQHHDAQKPVNEEEKMQSEEIKADATDTVTAEKEPQNNQTEQEKPAETDCKEELAKQKDAFLRLYAEFDNFKKRSAKERVEWIKMASSEVLEALLPVLDDMERGLAEAKKHSKEEDIKGFELIYNKLVSVLNQKGLSAMEVKVGDEFNVDMHDAIAQIPSPDEAMKGKVIDVTQKGYKIGDKIIRYAKVVVGA
ncbi:MAG: nucleotide exchange factor GrpE [Flavobacteriales bacterium]|nr:nucleotide exchange factor GrpE [Flavobacteriales bacterium]